MSRTLTGGCRSIVTTEAGARHSRMIEVHRSPAGVDVTILTSIRTLNMSTAFTRRCGSVMATETGSDCSGMIKVHCRPAGLDMT